MGVDFLTCSKCERNYPDCGEGYTWCVCGYSFCSKKCAELKYEKEDDDEPESCCICREEHIRPEALLNFLLNYYSLTLEQAERMYRA